MKKTIVLFIVLTWAAVYADMAPATFSGVTLTITNNDAVRMKKEEVDIYYQGRYTQVKAVFVMENLTGETASLDIGFPITDLEDPESMFKDLVKGKERLFDFQVRENGRPVTSIVAQKITQKIPDRIDKKWLWFAWKQAFPPGETVVDVEYRISPNLSYGSCFKNIYYILSTGALWRNNIGEARISVHFPKTITNEQVTSATNPANYAIEGNTVTWKFRDFEPTEKDNLQLEFIPFWIYDKVQSLRMQIKNNPQAVKPRLELARLYFATIGGNVGSSLPGGLDEKRFNEEVLQKIAETADRDYFLSSYEKDGKTGLYRPNFKYADENSQRINRLIGILSDNGYEPNTLDTAKFKPFRQEAETMLMEAVALDARNAEVWNTFLYYYPRLHYGTISMHIPSGQKELIRRGAAACPEDPLLRLWLEFIDDNMKTVPENIGELEYISGSVEWVSPRIFGERVSFPIDDQLIKRIGRYYDQKAIVFYAKIKRNSKGWYNATTIDLEKAGASSFQKKLLALFHGHKRFTYELVLKKKPLIPVQKDEIVQLLSRSGFFSFLYSKKIGELAEKSGIVVDNMKIWKEINLSE
jgi:hypothetical protein